MARLMELTLQTRFLGQIFINRWNYVWDSASPSPGGLAQKLINATGAPLYDEDYPTGSIMKALRVSLQTELKFEIMSARDVDNVFDIAEYLFGSGVEGQGGAGSTPVAPFITFGFRSSKSRADIKRGAKRIGGLPATALSTSGAFSASGLSALDLIAEAMSAVLSDGAGVDFVPAVVKKKKVEILDDDGEPTGTYKYVYYGDPDLNVQNSMFPVVWDGQTTQRTQTSRQFGRGR